MSQLIGNSLALTALRYPGAGGGSTNPPIITANAVNFDGSTNYLTRAADLTGIADSKTGILSVWLNFAADGSGERILSGSDLTNTNLQITRTTGNLFQMIFKNAAAATIVLIENVTTMLNASGWVHILSSWDLSTPVVQIYLDDSEDADPTPTTLTDDTIAYSTGLADWFVGTTEAGGTPTTDSFNGDMAELYFQDGEFLDFTDEDNRRLFISSGGKPVDLGSDGSNPTGTQPIIYLTGATATWHTNTGSGGGMTEVGALTDASTSPSD